jgi:DNA polymerase-3 subunit epsilon
LRPNGDVLYVGKAASLKKRVANHFKSGARSTERALEMLTQAHDVEVTEVATALEAALLETDEIKRLDPPYNVQLRGGARQAWFASRDWSSTVAVPDVDHRVGPLPSRASVAGIGAMRALLEGEAPTEALRASALGVPPRFAPEAAMFDEVWVAFARDHLSGAATARSRILRAAACIELGDDAADDDESERDSQAEPGPEPEPEGWDREDVLRALQRTVVHQGLLVRRARALSLLSNASIAFREPRSTRTRLLVVTRGEIAERSDIDSVFAVGLRDPVAAPSREARLAAFDAALYDRLRVLATELRRVADHGGAVAIRIGRHLRAPAAAPTDPRTRS